MLHKESAGSCVSCPGSELLHSLACGIPRGEPLDEVGSTFGHPKHIGNWVIPLTTQYKRLLQAFTIRLCRFRKLPLLVWARNNKVRRGKGQFYSNKAPLTLVLLQVRHPTSPGFFLTCQKVTAFSKENQQLSQVATGIIKRN